MKINHIEDLLKLIDNLYTGEVYMDVEGMDYRVTCLINGQKVSEKDWSDYIFNKKLNNLLENND